MLILTAILMAVCGYANDVQTVGIGIGSSKDHATQLALRNALENVYGVYLSSSTTLSDDKILKDDITTVSFGKIINYKVIDCSQNMNGQYVVTVDAKVSLDKLATFVGENTNTSVKFDGAGWGMQLKMNRLNTKNEEKAALDIVKAIANLYVDLTPSISIESIKNEYDRYNNIGAKGLNQCLTMSVKLDKKGSSNAKTLHKLVDDSFKALKNPGTKKFLSSHTEEYYKILKNYIDSRFGAFIIKDEGNGKIYPIYNPAGNRSFLNKKYQHTNVELIKDGRSQVVSTSNGGFLFVDFNLGYNWQNKIKIQSPTMGGGFVADEKMIIIRIFYNESALERVTELSVAPLPLEYVNELKEYYLGDLDIQ